MDEYYIVTAFEDGIPVVATLSSTGIGAGIDASADINTILTRLGEIKTGIENLSLGGGGLTQAETTTAVENALTANADIEAIKNQLTALVVTSYSQGETQTAATGSNWTALASGATKNVTVRNRTGTNIDIRGASQAVFFTMANNEDITLPVLANSSEWEIKRGDNSNTQVTVKFLRFA